MFDSSVYFPFLLIVIFYRIHILSRSQNSNCSQWWKQPNQESCFSRSFLPPGLNPTQKMSHIPRHSGIKANLKPHWVPWRDRISAGIHWILTIYLSHGMDLKMEGSMKYLYQNRSWTSFRQQDTASATLEPVKQGIGFIEQRPCSHPRHFLILKTLLSAMEESAVSPLPPTTQGKLIRKPIIPWKF